MEKKTAKGLCFLCEAPSDAVCDDCGEVWFCGGEHGRLHRGSDESDRCLPFRVERLKNVGRVLRATRDIAPGELVFVEHPLTVGPLHDTAPVCLGCFAQADGSHKCAECGLPMCGEACEDAWRHEEAECALFSRVPASDKPKFKDFSAEHPFYQCLTPLRCLLLRDREDGKGHWRAMQVMMDHASERRSRDDDHWRMEQNNTVRYLRERLGLAGDFSEAEVDHAIGLLEVNAFEVRGGGRGRGVFPLTAVMSHSCVANARYTMFADHRAECRATVAIAGGEEITDYYVSPLHGTRYRRTHLRDGWYFDCSCRRCKDPAELGTYLDAFNCKSCGDGNLISTDPLSYTAEYACDECHASVSRADLDTVEDDLVEKVEAVDTSDVEAVAALLNECLEHVRPTNYLALSLKRHLVHLYGRTPGWRLNEALAERKAGFCRELLSAFDVVAPGLTKERGLTLFELVSVKLFTFASNNNNNNSDDQVDLLKTCLVDLKDAVACLENERPGTFEHMVRLTAEKQMEQCGELIEVLKFAQFSQP